MTYQLKNEAKQNAQHLQSIKTSYDENGYYIRRKNWPGMNWITRSKRLAIYLRDNLQCQYCGKTIFSGIRLTLDHVTPINSYSGSHMDEKNIVTCCSNCNFRKQDLGLTAFAKIIARETKVVDYTTIIRNVRNSLKRVLDTKKAIAILKAQKNWSNTFNHLKNQL